MKVTIVAEIGSNWGGSVSIAKKLVNRSKLAGADAVKFQMWRASDLYSSNHPNWDVIKKSELNFKKAEKIKNYADSIGIEFFCSVFYPEAVDFLESLNVKRYKVASRTCLFKDPYSFETLKRKARTNKPVIISMGMGGNKIRINEIFSKNNKLFCYCISDYPLAFEKIKWKQAVNYDGFSDHTIGITAPIIFTVMKKQQGASSILIEKHIKLKELKGPDAATSIDTEQLRDLVNHVNLIKNAKLK